MAGTNQGSLIIWNKLFDIDLKHIDRHRIIKHEHSKDCHLTLWNKEGNKIISASFDGTARIWPFNSNDFAKNKEAKSSYVFDSELGRSQDIKCYAVAWSCKGRYAVASFCKKTNKRAEDKQNVVSNI